MRPVKKSLKALGQTDESLSREEQLGRARRCLLQIGNHINMCLEEYKDPVQISEWRSNLWEFASKFTTFKARKLYRTYKNLIKQGGITNVSAITSPDKKEEATNSSKVSLTVFYRANSTQ